MKDCHVHTTMSYDGKATMQEYINVSGEKNVDELTFTEHYDICENVNTIIKPTNLKEYYNEYLKVKNSTKLKLNFGIEVGLQTDQVKELEQTINKYPFDFVIGSSHIVQKKDIGDDKSFFEGRTQKEVYLIYLEEVLRNIKLFNNFDVYGHLDNIVRYGNYVNKKIYYNDFREILDEILIELIRKDKGIEINSSGIGYGLGSPHPNIEILSRYKELGGKIITMGSDAHKSKELVKNFDKSFDLLEQVGFDEITIFHQRNPEFVKIKQLKK